MRLEKRSLRQGSTNPEALSLDRIQIPAPTIISIIIRIIILIIVSMISIIISIIIIGIPKTLIIDISNIKFLQHGYDSIQRQSYCNDRVDAVLDVVDAADDDSDDDIDDDTNNASRR